MPGPNPTLVWVAMQCDDEPGRETRLLHASNNDDDDAHGGEHRRHSNLEKIFMFPLGGEAGVQGDSRRLPTPTPLVRSGGSALLQYELPYLNLGWTSPGSNDLTENSTPWSQRGGRAPAPKRHWSCPCSPEAYSGTNFSSGIANHYRPSCPPPMT